MPNFPLWWCSGQRVTQGDAFAAELKGWFPSSQDVYLSLSLPPPPELPGLCSESHRLSWPWFMDGQEGVITCFSELTLFFFFLWNRAALSRGDAGGRISQPKSGPGVQLDIQWQADRFFRREGMAWRSLKQKPLSWGGCGKDLWFSETFSLFQIKKKKVYIFFAP